MRCCKKPWCLCETAEQRLVIFNMSVIWHNVVHLSYINIYVDKKQLMSASNNLNYLTSGRFGEGLKFSQFHAVFQKNWQIHRLAPQWMVGTPHGESWICPCSHMKFIQIVQNTFDEDLEIFNDFYMWPRNWPCKVLISLR